jgi:hypothetical protein
MITIIVNRLTRMVPYYTCLNTCSNFLIRCFWSSSSNLHPSQAVLVLFVASMTHRQTYKQQIKATKNSTPVEQHKGTELVTRVNRNEYRRLLLIKKKRLHAYLFESSKAM